MVCSLFVAWSGLFTFEEKADWLQLWLKPLSTKKLDQTGLSNTSHWVEIGSMAHPALESQLYYSVYLLTHYISKLLDTLGSATSVESGPGCNCKLSYSGE